MTTGRLTYERALHDAARENENIVVMTAENRAAIRNLPGALGDRFIDMGICEQTMVGAAAGLALRGRIPVVHALATFLTMRAFEFIRTDVGIGNLPVKLVGAIPGFLSEANGPTHQALEDIGLMRGIPHMQVFCPADEQELTEGLVRILETPSPCYIRYNASTPVVDHRGEFEVGRAEVLSEGEDVGILVYGFLLAQAVQAKEILEDRGYSVRLVNMRMLKPADEEAIIDTVCRTSLVVTLEDHFVTGGLYSIVAETMMRRRQSANVLPIALDDRWFNPALLHDVLLHEGFNGPQIAGRILSEL